MTHPRHRHRPLSAVAGDLAVRDPGGRLAPGVRAAVFQLHDPGVAARQFQPVGVGGKEAAGRACAPSRGGPWFAAAEGGVRFLSSAWRGVSVFTLLLCRPFGVK